MTKNIGKSDLKRWGVMVLVGAAIGAINAVAGQVVPEIEGMDGPASGMAALILMLIADFVRKYLTTPKVEEVKVDGPTPEPAPIPEPENKKRLLDRILRR